MKIFKKYVLSLASFSFIGCAFIGSEIGRTYDKEIIKTIIISEGDYKKINIKSGSDCTVYIHNGGRAYGKCSEICKLNNKSEEKCYLTCPTPEYHDVFPLQIDSMDVYIKTRKHRNTFSIVGGAVDIIFISVITAIYINN